ARLDGHLKLGRMGGERYRAEHGLPAAIDLLELDRAPHQVVGRADRQDRAGPRGLEVEEMAETLGRLEARVGIRPVHRRIDPAHPPRADREVDQYPGTHNVDSGAGDWPPGFPATPVEDVSVLRV